MIKSIKYELKPTKPQVQKLHQGLGNCRFVYNWALDRKIKERKTFKSKNIVGQRVRDFKNKTCTLIRWK